MNKEIKEILEELEDCKITKYLNYNLDNKDARIILDYITNLQEDFNKVQKELDYADNYNVYLISKIDKAINYIEENCFNYYVEKPNYRGFELINVEELLDILHGENND